LGGYYAKKAGLPIEKILISSNVNNILTDWITTGEYDISDRELILTESPAMDILKSSNIERVMFDKFGAERTKELMDELNSTSRFQLTEAEQASLQEDFTASYSDDAECENEIARYAKKGYIMDPHTATCIKAYETLREKSLPTVIYSTAEWTKFSPTVAKSLGYQAQGDIEALQWMETHTDVSVPPMIHTLFEKPVIHSVVVEKDAIKGEMLNFL
jgi:threonine synthase